MIRDRTLGDYMEMLGLDLISLAKETLQRSGRIAWYDVCCGDFRAGHMLSGFLLQEYQPSQLKLVGLDTAPLLREIPDVPGISIIREDAVSASFSYAPDLITCVEGLLHIQGQTGRGLQALSHWYNSLKEGGRLAFTMLQGQITHEGRGIESIFEKELGAQVTRSRHPQTFHGKIMYPATVTVTRGPEPITY